ncbi:MAG: RidA family protein [Acidimicrobiales bacterium]|nr:RidA family protein [Acidimicrobiales bacterium]
MANNLAAVLAEAGLAPSAVVSVRVYAINEDAAGAWAKVRKALLPTNPPASTLVYVAGLARPEFLLEVEAFASALPSSVNRASR